MHSTDIHCNMITDGIPYDGVPIEDEVTVEVALTVFFSILASVGVVFVVVCLVFNFVFRKKECVNVDVHACMLHNHDSTIQYIRL